MFSPALISTSVIKTNLIISIHKVYGIFIRKSLFTIVLWIVPLFARSIPQEIIEFLTALHVANKSFLAAVALQISKKCVNSLHGHSERGHWVNDTVVPILLEFFDVDVRCLSKLSHISEEKYTAFMGLKLLRNDLELLSCVEALREDHICTCINVGLRSLYTFLQAKYSLCICTSTDNKFSIRYFDRGLPCNFDFIHHLLSSYQLLPIQVATSLREDLVFNVQS